MKNAVTDPPALGYRLTIEAVGLRKSDAAAYALRLIGMMMQEAHRKGHSCGGELGNASGNWSEVTHHVDACRERDDSRYPAARLIPPPSKPA